MGLKGSQFISGMIKFISIGIGFWSMTISKLIRSMTVLGDPANVAYQQDIDAVNRFCTFNRLPSHLARELRRYMHNTREVHAQQPSGQAALAEADALPRLPHRRDRLA